MLWMNKNLAKTSQRKIYISASWSLAKKVKHENLTTSETQCTSTVSNTGGRGKRQERQRPGGWWREMQHNETKNLFEQLKQGLATCTAQVNHTGGGMPKLRYS